MSIHLTSKHGVAIAMALVVSAASAHAQEWQLSAQAGRIRSALDPAAAVSESFALGLRYDGQTSGLRLSAGIPASSTEALWGGLGAWRRLAVGIGGLRIGADLAGHAYLTDDRTASPERDPILGPLDPTPSAVDRSGYALAGQAMPVLGFEADQIQIHARAGVSRYAAAFGHDERDRSVRLADVQLTLMPTNMLAVVPVVRRFQAAGEQVSTYTGVSAVAGSDVASVWGSVGQWSKGVAEGTPWSAGARLRLHTLLALEASARRDVFDPLYLQPPQTSWSFGVAVPLGRRTRSVPPPIPSAYVNGQATIRLPVAKSKTPPAIAGDFNSWTPAPMGRDGDDWTYTVALSPGVYHYAFVASDGEWFVPEGVPGRKDDGMGGHVAVLVVR